MGIRLPVIGSLYRLPGILAPAIRDLSRPVESARLLRCAGAAGRRGGEPDRSPDHVALFCSAGGMRGFCTGRLDGYVLLFSFPAQPTGRIPGRHPGTLEDTG